VRQPSTRNFIGRACQHRCATGLGGAGAVNGDAVGAVGGHGRACERPIERMASVGELLLALLGRDIPGQRFGSIVGGFTRGIADG